MLYYRCTIGDLLRSTHVCPYKPIARYWHIVATDSTRLKTGQHMSKVVFLCDHYTMNPSIVVCWAKCRLLAGYTHMTQSKQEDSGQVKHSDRVGPKSNTLQMKIRGGELWDMRV